MPAELWWCDWTDNGDAASFDPQERFEVTDEIKESGEWSRFWAKVQPSADGCWYWTAAKNGNGYGQFCPVRATKVTAHRYLYEALHGSVGAGLDLDHLCRHRDCVNPAHLEAVTHRENLRRGQTGRYERPTTCKHGHGLSGDNLFVNAKGHRICRECGREKRKRYRDRQKGVTGVWPTY